MKRLIIVVLSLITFNTFAMRCGTHLINEGDAVSRVVSLCGNPSQDNASDLVYLNKDGDGMNYYIHVNGAGIVDSISYSRGIL